MGLLFESMAVRDLRIYAQSLGARLYYHGDESGPEADASIDGNDGGWAAIEIRLGGRTAITKATDSLRAVRQRVETARRGIPARLIVLTAFGRGYQTDDGIAVVPLTAMRPLIPTTWRGGTARPRLPRRCATGCGSLGAAPSAM